jgi:hypothetical protein
MKMKNELQLLQANMTENNVPFSVCGVCNCRDLDVEIMEVHGNLWNIEAIGKGVAITKTIRRDWNEDQRRWDFVQHDAQRIRIYSKVGLKAFKAWIDSLKDYDNTGYFTTKIFNY